MAQHEFISELAIITHLNSLCWRSTNESRLKYKENKILGICFEQKKQNLNRAHTAC